MQPIKFHNKNNPDYESQLQFLIKREFYVRYFKFRKLPLHLLIITFVALGIYIFTPSNSLIVLKAVSIVMLALIWVFVIFVGTLILYKWIRRQKWKKRCVEIANSTDEGYILYFTEERIYFEGDKYKTELTWDSYAYWTENSNSIFLFPETNIYDSLYYSVRDLGPENYSIFKAIASSKLEALTN